MIWRKSSERQIGNYVWWDSDTQSEALLPLLYCLSFAIENNNSLDYFLRGILTGDEGAPNGGDPGWLLYQDRLKNGCPIYKAWTYGEISALDPPEAEYDEPTVKLHVRRTLENFRTAHPERGAEVDEIIIKYDL